MLETSIRKNPSFQKEWTRTQEKSGCATKIIIFALMFLTNNNVGTETGFCDLKNLPRSVSKHENFNNFHIQSQIIGYLYRFSKLQEIKEIMNY